jgi:PP-loop superfamily ATP-utilizing enzyme
MDAQKVRSAIVEMSNSMTRMDAERDLIKEIVEKINEEEFIDKRVIRKMARVYHKQNFAEESTINEEFETHFKNIMS